MRPWWCASPSKARACVRNVLISCDQQPTTVSGVSLVTCGPLPCEELSRPMRYVHSYTHSHRTVDKRRHRVISGIFLTLIPRLMQATDINEYIRKLRAKLRRTYPRASIVITTGREYDPAHLIRVEADEEEKAEAYPYIDKLLSE